jgi:hypothetical protein
MPNIALVGDERLYRGCWERLNPRSAEPQFLGLTLAAFGHTRLNPERRPATLARCVFGNRDNRSTKLRSLVRSNGSGPESSRSILEVQKAKVLRRPVGDRTACPALIA